VVDKNGNLLHDDPDDGAGGRPEVLRGELRSLLLNSLPPGTVHWGYKVQSISSLGEGKHQVHFTNGATITTALLIGAEGAWSKVRNLLSDAKPTYVGTTFIETYLYSSSDKHVAVSDIVGGGSMFALSPGKGIAAHREPHGVLHAYIALKKPKEWIEQIDFAHSKQALEKVAQEFGDWAPELRALILESEVAIPRPIHALPADHKWNHVPGVTLLGDAAHLMAPSGEGANLAMFDAAELARFIIAHPHDIERAFINYEAELFPRSSKAAKEAIEIFEVLYGEEAPQSLVNFFNQLK
jgi:2-polyprenyl-6-methoxyphenol hydroxylase-like FAD-dependent oxidoreductase